MVFMIKLIKNNLVNFIAIAIQEAALVQDLGQEAEFEEFNEENSAFPLEKRGIKEPAKIPTGSRIQAGEEETTISESEPLQEEITLLSEEIIGSESKSFEEETSSPSVDLEEVVPSIQEEVLSSSEPFEEIPTSPSESTRVPYVLGILLDLLASDSTENSSPLNFFQNFRRA